MNNNGKKEQAGKQNKKDKVYFFEKIVWNNKRENVKKTTH